MKKISISDITLREYGKNSEQISFREKVECAKLLDRVGVDVIETAKISNVKTDVLFLHTIAPLVKNAVISAPVGLDESAIELSWNAVKSAAHPRLQVNAPTSTVQMEFICHMKPAKMLEAIAAQVASARALCPDVEFVAEDATRSETAFLASVIKAAIENGATTITVCDSEGTKLPAEISDFVKELYSSVPELNNVTLSIECSDKLSMGCAAALAAVSAGALQIKTGVSCKNAPSLSAVSDVLRLKGDSLGIKTGLNHTLLDHSTAKISSDLTGKRSATSPFDNGVQSIGEDFNLTKDDDINTVSKYIALLGYDLSEDDVAKVYERFKQLAERKHIGAKELDAIIASSALQVTPTYKLVSYVINSGNVITATANIELEKDGTVIKGISLGDGPIDAAFLAIEQIIGHHYELDDFQIQAVTEGREAVGEALVKLRASGKLYSGRGISTDIIGASIRAYINALNKICFENA